MPYKENWSQGLGRLETRKNTRNKNCNLDIVLFVYLSPIIDSHFLIFISYFVE